MKDNSIERIVEIPLSFRPRIGNASFLVSLFESPISFDFFEERGEKKGDG